MRDSFLLDDEPSDQDRLGSHDSISKSIADLIRNELGGKSIALIGAYGSGKSTVISLLRREIDSASESDQIKIFSFDAWAHQGDPLRRSFLEDLIAFLRRERWIPKGSLQKELGELSHRHETSRTTPKVLVTWRGLAIIASAPVALLSAEIVDKIWWAAFGIVLPIILALIFSVIRSFELRHILSPQDVTNYFAQNQAR